MPSTSTSASHQRNIHQRFLHHPLEIAPQETINEENIVRSLMVRHEDVGSLPVHQLIAFNTYWEEHHPAHQAAPNHGRIVSPEMRPSNGRANDGDHSAEDGAYEQNRRSNEDLIKAIEKRRQARETRCGLSLFLPLWTLRCVVGCVLNHGAERLMLILGRLPQHVSSPCSRWQPSRIPSRKDGCGSRELPETISRLSGDSGWDTCTSWS